MESAVPQTMIEAKPMSIAVELDRSALVNIDKQRDLLEPSG